MFERLTASILSRFLGEYVEGGSFNREAISLGVLNGNVVLEDLVLKKNLLQMYQMPLDMKLGLVQRLEIKLPLSSLGIDPISISLQGLYFVVSPNFEWNQESKDTHRQAVKQAQIAAAEMFRKGMFDDIDDKGNHGWSGRAQNWVQRQFLNAIMRGIEVEVKDIHIRYEDTVSSLSGAFAFGFTCHSFTAESTPDSSEEYEAFTKNVQISQFSMYWDTQEAGKPFSTMIGDLPQKEACSILKVMMACTNENGRVGSSHHYILEPMNAISRISIPTDFTSSVSKFSVAFYIEQVVLRLEEFQYKDILSCAAGFSLFQALQQYSEGRPRVGVKQDPIRWWHYAVHSVLKRIRKRKNRWSLKKIAHRREIRLEYKHLWTIQMGWHPEKYTSSEIENARLQKLEADLDVEDILTFRAMAEREIQQSAGSKGTASTGFGGWIRRGLLYGANTDISVHKADEDFKNLCHMIHFDPMHMSVPKQAPLSTSLELDLDLVKGSFTLFKNSFKGAKGDVESNSFLRLEFDSLEMSARVNGNDFSSIEACLQLLDFRIFEIAEEETQILSRRCATWKHDMIPSLFCVNLYVKPPNDVYDNTLRVVLEQLEIILDPTAEWIEKLMEFVKPPIILEQWPELEMAAVNRLNSAKSKLEAKLQLIVESRTRSFIDIDIKSPLFIIPIIPNRTELNPTRPQVPSIRSFHQSNRSETSSNKFIIDPIMSEIGPIQTENDSKWLANGSIDSDEVLDSDADCSKSISEKSQREKSFPTIDSNRDLTDPNQALLSSSRLQSDLSGSTNKTERSKNVAVFGELEPNQSKFGANFDTEDLNRPGNIPSSPESHLNQQIFDSTLDSCTTNCNNSSSPNRLESVLNRSNNCLNLSPSHNLDPNCSEGNSIGSKTESNLAKGECIVVDFGTIQLVTTSLANLLSADDINLDKNKLADSTKGSPTSSLHLDTSRFFYDIFTLTASRIGVFMFPNQEFSDILMDDIQYRLIDRLDISVDIYVSIVPNDSTTCNIKMYANFPPLRIRLSERKLVRLYRSITILNSAFESSSIKSSERKEKEEMDIRTRPELAPFLEFQETLEKRFDSIAKIIESQDKTGKIYGIKAVPSSEEFFDAEENVSDMIISNIGEKSRIEAENLSEDDLFESPSGSVSEDTKPIDILEEKVAEFIKSRKSQSLVRTELLDQETGKKAVVHSQGPNREILLVLFTIPLIQVDILRDCRILDKKIEKFEIPEQPLLIFRVEGVSTHSNYRSYDGTVSIGIHDLHVLDCLSNLAYNKNSPDIEIFSSLPRNLQQNNENLSGNFNEEDSIDFLQLRYFFASPQLNQISPNSSVHNENMEKQELDICVQDGEIILDQCTVTAILELVDSIYSAGDEIKDKREMPVEEPVVQSNSSMQINIDMGAISTAYIVGGVNVGYMIAYGMHCSLLMEPDQYVSHLLLSNLEMLHVDGSNQGAENQILGFQQESSEPITSPLAPGLELKVTFGTDSSKGDSVLFKASQPKVLLSVSMLESFLQWAENCPYRKYIFPSQEISAESSSHPEGISSRPEEISSRPEEISSRPEEISSYCFQFEVQIDSPVIRIPHENINLDPGSFFTIECSTMFLQLAFGNILQIHTELLDGIVQSSQGSSYYFNGNFLKSAICFGNHAILSDCDMRFVALVPGEPGSGCDELFIDDSNQQGRFTSIATLETTGLPTLFPDRHTRPQFSVICSTLEIRLFPSDIISILNFVDSAYVCMRKYISFINSPDGSENMEQEDSTEISEGISSYFPSVVGNLAVGRFCLSLLEANSVDQSDLRSLVESAVSEEFPISRDHPAVQLCILRTAILVNFEPRNENRDIEVESSQNLEIELSGISLQASSGSNIGYLLDFSNNPNTTAGEDSADEPSNVNQAVNKLTASMRITSNQDVLLQTQLTGLKFIVLLKQIIHMKEYFSDLIESLVGEQNELSLNDESNSGGTEYQRHVKNIDINFSGENLQLWLPEHHRRSRQRHIKAVVLSTNVKFSLEAQLEKLLLAVFSSLSSQSPSNGIQNICQIFFSAQNLECFVARMTQPEDHFGSRFGISISEPFSPRSSVTHSTFPSFEEVSEQLHSRKLFYLYRVICPFSCTVRYKVSTKDNSNDIMSEIDVDVTSVSIRMLLQSSLFIRVYENTIVPIFELVQGKNDELDSTQQGETPGEGIFAGEFKGKFRSEGLRLIVVNSSTRPCSPLFIAKFAFSIENIDIGPSEIGAVSRNAMGRGIFTTSVVYFNTKCRKWESFIEPWELQLEVDATARYLDAHLASSPLTGVFPISLFSKKDLSINLSESSIRVFLFALKEFGVEHEKSSRSNLTGRSNNEIDQSLSLNWLKNETGVSINFTHTTTVNFSKILPSNCCVPLYENDSIGFDNWFEKVNIEKINYTSSFRSNKINTNSNFQINFSIPDISGSDTWNPAEAIKMDQSYVSMIPLCSNSVQFPGKKYPRILSRVEVVNGVNVLTLESPVLFKNSLKNVCFKVSLYSKSEAHLIWEGALPPDTTTPLPILYANEALQLGNEVRIQPIIKEREVFESVEFDLRKMDDVNHKRVHFKSLSCNESTLSLIVTLNKGIGDMEGRVLFEIASILTLSNLLAVPVMSHVVCPKEQVEMLEVGKKKQSLCHISSFPISLKFLVSGYKWSDVISIGKDDFGLSNKDQNSLNNGEWRNLNSSVRVSKKLLNVCTSNGVHLQVQLLIELLANGGVHVKLWVPFWIINSLSLPLEIMQIPSGNSTVPVLLEGFSPSEPNKYLDAPPSTPSARVGGNERQTHFSNEDFDVENEEKAFLIDGHLLDSPSVAMLSYAVHKKLQGGFISVRVPPNKEWSSKINIDKIESKQVIEAYSMVVSTESDRGQLHKTKVIRISPRFVIANELNVSIEIRQLNAPEKAQFWPYLVPPRDTIPVHWFAPHSKHHPIQVELHIPKYGRDCIGLLNMYTDANRDSWIRMKNACTQQDIIIHFHGYCHDFHIVGAFKEASPDCVPYSIQNRTCADIIVHQVGEGTPLFVPSFQSRPFAFDAPLKNLAVSVQIQADDKQELGIYSLDEDKHFELYDLYNVDIFSGGLTRVLRISTKDQHVEHESSLNEDMALKKSGFSVSLFMSGLGVRLIEDVPNLRELGYLYIGQLAATYIHAYGSDVLECIIMTVQIDNLLDNTRFPVMLSPLQGNGYGWWDKPKAIEAKNILEKYSAFHNNTDFSSPNKATSLNFVPSLELISWIIFSEKLNYLKLLFLKFCPMDVCIDGELVLAAISLITRLSNQFAAIDEHETNIEDVHYMLRNPSNLPQLGSYSGLSYPQLYIESLQILPVRVQLSLCMSDSDIPPSHLPLDSPKISYSDPNREAKNPLKLFLRGLGFTFSNFENAPLRWKSFEMGDIMVTYSQLLSNVGSHFAIEVASQAYRVIGSSELIGNPMGITVGVLSGIRDLCYQPLYGIVRGSPTSVVLGFYKGIIGLSTSVIASLIESSGGIASSLANGLSASGAIALRSPSGSLLYPTNVINGLKLALMGLTRDPISRLPAYKHGGYFWGTSMFVMGAMKGVLGVALRPTYGGLVMTSSACRSVSHILYPRHYRRHKTLASRYHDVPEDNIDVTKVEENLVMESELKKSYIQLNSDAYVWYTVLEDDILLFVKDQQLVMARKNINDRNSPHVDRYETLWEADISKIAIFKILKFEFENDARCEVQVIFRGAPNTELAARSIHAISINAARELKHVLMSFSTFQVIDNTEFNANSVVCD